jgi:hypothetical protein
LFRKQFQESPVEYRKKMEGWWSNEVEFFRYGELLVTEIAGYF